MSFEHESGEEEYEVQAPVLVKQFKIQTTSTRMCPHTDLPWPAADVYLWSNGRMGVRPDDLHGSWCLSEHPRFIRLTYNYRGWAYVPLATTKYLPIEGTSSWIVAPPHMQAEGRVPNETVMIPVSRAGEGLAYEREPRSKRPRVCQ